jgi:hypothetical protein
MGQFPQKNDLHPPDAGRLKIGLRRCTIRLPGWGTVFQKNTKALSSMFFWGEAQHHPFIYEE